ncbi:DUF1579 domain-containing protein [Phenylobacterium sp.]|uniref:DUF1579 domain-containing protein n=1 Tax=Phenylobacterium sp. TaxID=1871053 RepID=UPI0027307E58|nr:DUF1579 domain-containing protein [Phenylobacterium sp.]MDP1874530.1 DUF1579 domain-containing protein [Phenylobacterium sp.]
MLTGPDSVAVYEALNAPTRQGITAMQTTPDLDDGRQDFDFLVGRWTIRHRRLNARLAGCGGWTEFDGTCVMRKAMRGLGNMDDNQVDLPEGAYAAVTVRRFDPARRRWSIWWLDSRYPDIDPPVHGAFTDGEGLFLGDDVFQGRPIKVRFLWSAITPVSCEWRQAFSEDGGATWETNWEMRFTRAG